MNDDHLATRGYFNIIRLRVPFICSQLQMIKEGDIRDCQCCGRQPNGDPCRRCHLFVRTLYLNLHTAQSVCLWAAYLSERFVSVGGTMDSFSNRIVGSQTMLIEMDGTGHTVPSLRKLDQTVFSTLCDLLFEGAKVLTRRYALHRWVICRVLAEPFCSLCMSPVPGILL